MTLRFARNAALRLMAAEMAGIEIEPAADGASEG